MSGRLRSAYLGGEGETLFILRFVAASWRRRRTVPAFSPFIFAAAFPPLSSVPHYKSQNSPGLVGRSVGGRVGRLIGRLLPPPWLGRSPPLQNKHATFSFHVEEARGKGWMEEAIIGSAEPTSTIHPNAADICFAYICVFVFFRCPVSDETRGVSLLLCDIFFVTGRL